MNTDDHSRSREPRTPAARPGVAIIEAAVYAGAVRTRYLRAGNGPTLVLLHGAGARAEEWQPVIGPLASHFRVIAPEVPEDDCPDDLSAPADAPNSGTWLRDFLDGLGVDRVSIVASREAGRIALRFASEYPERVERLLVIDPAGTGQQALHTLSADQLLSLSSTRPARQDGSDHPPDQVRGSPSLPAGGAPLEHGAS